MGKTWRCPAHQGDVDLSRAHTISKSTGKGRWAINLRCQCGAHLRITKFGIGVVQAPPAPDPRPLPIERGAA